MSAADRSAMATERVLVHIGEVAEKSGMSSRTLRHYEEIGLLTATGRTEGGFRVYTDEDFRRLMTIRRMKALSYSTGEMAELLGRTWM